MDNYMGGIREKLQKGELVVGTHVHLNDNIITEMMGDVGYDFIWLDMEHTAFDRNTTQNHLISCRAAHTASFVRVPAADPGFVKPILDMNPSAVIFPMILDEKDAEKAVAGCRYPPEGVRGYGPKRANEHGLIANERYLAAASDLWVILQIEHIQAVKNLEAILAINGVDSIVVGPCDLSASIGLIGQTRHAEVRKLMDEIARIARKHDKPFGVSIGTNELDIQDWIGRGAAWISVGTDEEYLIRGALHTKTLTERLYKETMSVRMPR